MPTPPTLPAPPAEFDAAMMRRAIGLAMRGRGTVEPNPMVGCVIVKEGRVIGEGWHQKYGGAHAEPMAIANCVESPIGATAYVTLEPCCHTGKKTPPCVPVVVGAGIKRVVVGCLDPNPEVNGKGVGMLREAGVEVVGPVLEGECKQLIAPFIARVNLKRPYVTMKWAETADGKVAGAGGQRVQISNESSHRVMHGLRARSDAILVGIGTVLTDDPMLTARGVEGARPLVRYVLDRRLRIPNASRLIQTAGQMPVAIGFGNDARPERIAEMQSLGVHLFPSPFAGRALVDAYTRSVTHLMVEPGPTLARAFFEDNLVDRIWVIRSPKVIGDGSAPDAARVPEHYLKVGEINLGGDVLTEYLNPKSGAFFAPMESADFVRVRQSV